MRHLSRLIPLALALTAPFAQAQEENSCVLPGVLVIEDAAGDSTLAPSGEDGFADILTVHGAELPGTNAITFTMKVADLATVPPQAAWIIRFATETLPDDGNEDYFVAMLSGPDGSTHFVYGADGFQYGVPAGEPRQFYVRGELNAASGFAADGTITFVLDRQALPSLDPGLEIFNVIPSVRLVTPTAVADTPPFFTNADNNTILDDAPSGFYPIAGTAACGKSVAARSASAMAAGALPLASLGLMLLGALLRRR